MPNLTILRPLASVGAFVFDVELSNTRGDVRDVSSRRIARGASIIDHSVLNPTGRVFTLGGRVSNLPQPQNIGRPSPSPLTSAIESLINQTAAGLIGQSTRLADAESTLRSQIEEGEEVEVISKKFGKIRAIVTSWQASDGDDDSFASTYQVSLLEIRRAGGLLFANPGEAAAALNGSGATNKLGPTSTVAEEVDFVA